MDNMPYTVKSAPLYQQIKTTIVQRIVSGEWGPGSFLPSEQALAQEYGVSQGTVRKALDVLTQEKILTRYQGKGTAVAVFETDCSQFPFFQLQSRQGKNVFPSSKILSIDGAQASQDEQRLLQLAPEDRVIRIDRVRFIEGAPVIHEQVSLPAARFPRFPFEVEKIPNTLYAYYQSHCGVTVGNVSETIRIVAPTKAEENLFHIRASTPLLLVTRVGKDIAEQPVEMRESRIYLGENFQYGLNLG